MQSAGSLLTLKFPCFSAGSPWRQKTSLTNSPDFGRYGRGAASCGSGETRKLLHQAVSAVPLPSRAFLRPTYLPHVGMTPPVFGGETGVVLGQGDQGGKEDTRLVQIDGLRVSVAQDRVRVGGDASIGESGAEVRQPRMQSAQRGRHTVARAEKAEDPPFGGAGIETGREPFCAEVCGTQSELTRGRKDRFEGTVASIIQMNVKGKRLAARTAAARQARLSDALSA